MQFMVLGKYSNQGLGGFIQNPNDDRRAAISSMMEKAGGKLIDLHLTRGEYDIVAIGELLYFIADDGYRGSEIWRSDGTELGTIIVEDLTFGPSDTSFYNINSTGQMLVEAGDILYFVPSTDYGYELWNNMNIETKVLIDN